MKLCIRLLALFAVAATFALTSCAGPAGYSYQNVTLTLAFNPICSGVCINGNIFTKVPSPTKAGDLVGPVGAVELPVGGGSGGCLELTAVVTNAPGNVTWTILPDPTPVASSTGTPPTPNPNTGTLRSTTGLSNYYCMYTGTPMPIYSGAQLAQAQALGLQQGETEIIASVPADPNDPTKVVTAVQTFTYQISTPPSQSGATMLVGITPANTLSMALGATYQFSGYVIGDNGYTPAPNAGIPAQSQLWYVNGIHGGSTSTGSITDTGLYTAPKAYPSTSKQVTITMASGAFPSIVTGGNGQGAATVITFQ
jgi:hypothetical protein